MRDSSAEALGTAMKVVGEKAVMQYVADLEAIKLTKIKEYCDKAVVAGKSKTTASESKEPAKAAEAPKRPAAVITSFHSSLIPLLLLFIFFLPEFSICVSLIIIEEYFLFISFYFSSFFY